MKGTRENSNRFLKRILVAGLLVASAILTGCAQIKLGAPVASIDNIQKAKASGAAPMALGDFSASSKEMDAGVSVRTNTVSSPQGSFAQYLKENLATDLRAAGLLDPTSKTVVTAVLTDSQIDAASSQGRGSLGARFTVTRAEAKLYDKELRVQATWESSFVGAIAIPAAVNEYSALYRKLVAQLLDDPAFRAAVKG